MPFLQRSKSTSNYSIYTTGNYANPNWIVSLSPAKVGSGISQWNAASIMGYPIHTGGLASGYVLGWSSSGWFPAPPGSGGGSGLSSVSPLYIASGLASTASPYSGTSPITIGLEVVTPGSSGAFNKFHTDTYGRVVSYTAVTSGDITGILGYSPSYSATSGVRQDGSIFYMGGTGTLDSLLTSSTAVDIGNSHSQVITKTFGIFIGQSTTNSATGNFTYSTMVGTSVGLSSTGLYGCTAIGSYAGNSASGQYNVYLGYGAGGKIIGNYNVDIVANNPSTLVEPSLISGTYDNKLHINKLLIGDTSTKKLAIGDVSLSNISPNSTLEILPKVTTDTGLIIKGTSSHSADLMQVKNSSNTVMMNINSSGTISGIVSYPIFQATGGITINDSYHGSIIEHTGLVGTGLYTIGTISNPSWYCMFVNYGSGLTIASGSNVFRSYTASFNLTNQYSSAFLYRRTNGEIFLCGDLW